MYPENQLLLSVGVVLRLRPLSFSRRGRILHRGEEYMKTGVSLQSTGVSGSYCPGSESLP